jgi:hypothetical protein
MPTSYELDYARVGNIEWDSNPNWEPYNLVNWGSRSTTDPTGKSTDIQWGGQQFDAIFPASGYRTSGDGTLGGVGSVGYYWGGSAASNDSEAFHLNFNSSYVNPASKVIRDCGFFVRCIKN